MNSLMTMLLAANDLLYPTSVRRQNNSGLVKSEDLKCDTLQIIHSILEVVSGLFFYGFHIQIER